MEQHIQASKQGKIFKRIKIIIFSSLFFVTFWRKIENHVVIAKEYISSQKRGEDFEGYPPGEIIAGEGIRYQIKTSATPQKPGTAVVLGLTSKSYRLKKLHIVRKLEGFTGENVCYTYYVSKIAANAFKDDPVIKTVIIPKNMKVIGKKAFYGCKNIKTIKIKSTKLKTVRKDAFSNLSSDITIILPAEKAGYYKRLLKKSGIQKAKYQTE